MNQLSLLNPPSTLPVPVDPSVLREDKGRLTNQTLRVIERLQHGPAFNHELLGVSSRFSARLFDATKRGWKFGKKNCGNGVWLYWIEGEPS